MLNWNNSNYQKFHPDDLELILKDFMKQGFAYKENDMLNLIPAVVTTPEGYQFTREDIEKVLNRKLLFGRKKQIEAIKAARFFQLAQTFYNDADDVLEGVIA